METLFETLKLKSKKSIHKTLRYQWIFIFFMLILGLVLILIEQDQLLTPGVLIIFFSFLLLIVTLFMTAIHYTKHLKSNIRHSIDVVYQHYADQYNLEEKTNYRYQTKDFNLSTWHLVPSYAQKDVTYVLKDEDINMHHAEAYNIIGDKRTRTYYFKGLYLLMPYKHQDFIYKDRQTMSEKIIDTLKDVYKKDEHDPKRYGFQKDYLEGIVYSENEIKLPPFLKNIYLFLHTLSYVSSVDIGVKNNQLEIAIQIKGTRLPYVKRYVDQELKSIKKIVDEDLYMIEKIKDFVK